MFLISRKENYEMDYKVINNLRCLSIDMINNAKSGHPGICLGAATILYTLISKHLEFNRKELDWVNRDRFILSAGHGAPLLYSAMYMLDLLTLDDIKNLRKLGSLTPGHPEITTPFIEMSTGPLGQGIASSVGFAISENYIRNNITKLINHYTYVLCGDGDLEEGISYEALSLAGKLNLNKLIILYDSNNVTLDSELERTSIENINLRFKAINFNVLEVDGDSVKDIDNAIIKAKVSDKPTIIICKTVIGKYSFEEGKNTVHGKPLSIDDISNIKKQLDIYDSPFNVSMDASSYFQDTVDSRMNLIYKDWQRNYNNAKEKDREGLKPFIEKNSTFDMPNLDIDYENKSLRDISGNIISEVAKSFPLLIGGSADLSSSCKTIIKDSLPFSKDGSGRNIYFGIREHAMGAIMNGIALSGLRPFGSTFLVFSDYLRGAIRMSALMKLPVIYVFTHDSITVGQDGATHEPIEQLYSLELIPNLYVYRPFDFNELVTSYKLILESDKPSVLILPRDNKEISDLTKGGEVEKGAYIIKKEETKDYIVLMANGEELGLALKVSEELKAINIDTRIISIPCMKLYKDNEYDLNPDNKPMFAITYGVSDYYYKFTRNVFGLDHFGDSASKEELLENYGFTSKHICDEIIRIVNGEGESNEE